MTHVVGPQAFSEHGPYAVAAALTAAVLPPAGPMEEGGTIDGAVAVDPAAPTKRIRVDGPGAAEAEAVPAPNLRFSPGCPPATCPACHREATGGQAGTHSRGWNGLA